MQVELLDRQRWLTRIELANAIFEYLEIFHNRQRRHTALDMLTPIEYENTHYHNRNRHTTDPSELTPQNRGTITFYLERMEICGVPPLLRTRIL